MLHTITAWLHARGRAAADRDALAARATPRALRHWPQLPQREGAPPIAHIRPDVAVLTPACQLPSNTRFRQPRARDRRALEIVGLHADRLGTCLHACRAFAASASRCTRRGREAIPATASSSSSTWLAERRTIGEALRHGRANRGGGPVRRAGCLARKPINSPSSPSATRPVCREANRRRATAPRSAAAAVCTRHVGTGGARRL